MVKVRYLGPDHFTRMKLRRAYIDLREESGKCRPMGPEYQAITALMGQIDATCRELLGEPVAEGGVCHSANPPGSRP